MELHKLIDIKQKIVEEYEYEPYFRGAGISRNKVVVYTTDNRKMAFNSEGIVTTKGKFISHTLSVLIHKFRPVLGGISIGAIDGLTGTAGGIIGDYMFSVSHVVANNPTGKSNNYVIQPGAADGGTYKDKIGKTVYNTKLENNEYGDLGIVKLNTKHINGVYSVGLINNFTKVYPGSKVIKVGRSTGLTTGLVGTIMTDAKVFYPELNKEVMLRNQFVVFGKGFSLPGDSGAPIIYNNKYAGVLVAGDNNHTLCTPSSFISRKLKEVINNE